MARIKLFELQTKKPLIVILGPTATGKTALSYLFYELIDSEFISADSRQIYKLMDIGTAKPSKEELKQYPFHLIDFLDLDENFSAGQFSIQAKKAIDEIYSKNKIPIVVGGTGLYISALCDSFIYIENEFDRSEEIRNDLNKQYEMYGKNYIYDLLLKIDEASARKYIDKNPRRIIRALEFYMITGTKFSEAHLKFNTKSEFNSIYFAINYPRQILYDRINNRCEKMWENGIIEEAKNILDLGYSTNLNSLNTVGYKEAILYLNNILSYNDALIEFKKNTRRYAKRQLTWFNKNPHINWLNSNIFDNLNLLKSIINEIIR
ncbi:MAG: tRNA (adenosine(37)-N6)-dimethylallyltransferase MiaA [Candidatus Kapaibacteriota bacterium]